MQHVLVPYVSQSDNSALCDNCAVVCLLGRYDGRGERRSAVRYKSRSPLPANARSRSPARAQPGRPEPVRRTRSPSRSPIASRPRERLLGKTPPPLPSRSRSSSPPSRYGHVQKSPEAPKRQRSRSPLAYSSRKVAGTYTSPSPQPKARSSYEKKYSMLPVRKQQNSPLPKAYALSSDRHQSPRWSRSRSKSADGKYSSRSPMHRIDNRSSSSTSPPRYNRSPVAREHSPPVPPVAAKREAVRQTRRSSSASKHSPVQRYHQSYTSAKHSASPEVVKRKTSPVYHHASSPALRRRSPSLHNRTSQRHASPATTRSRPESSYRTSAATQSGVVHWSPAPKRPGDNRKQSPVQSSRNGGRSPLDHGRSVTRASDRVRSGARQHASPVSRDRRSPRRRWFRSTTELLWHWH